MRTWKITWYPTPNEKVVFENCTDVEYERAGGGTSFKCNGSWQHLKGGATYMAQTR